MVKTVPFNLGVFIPPLSHRRRTKTICLTQIDNYFDLKMIAGLKYAFNYRHGNQLYRRVDLKDSRYLCLATRQTTKCRLFM